MGPNTSPNKESMSTYMSTGKVPTTTFVIVGHGVECVVVVTRRSGGSRTADVAGVGQTKSNSLKDRGFRGLFSRTTVNTIA